MAKHFDKADKISALGFIESGAYLYSAFSSLETAGLSARAAALDADWQNTRALYDEAIIADELLQGMADAEVAAAASGYALSSPQFATQAIDAATKAAKVRRAVQMRARVEAMRSLYGSANARRLGGERAIQLGAAAASGRLFRGAREVDTEGL